VPTFGLRIRELRQVKRLNQRVLAAKIGVHFTYVSRFENENLDFGPYPSEVLIVKLAQVLDADEDELLVLAKKILWQIRRRFLERPEVFRKVAALDDEPLDRLMTAIEKPRRLRG
jgi:transcriptional regulator with XRE-family HTH domain